MLKINTRENSVDRKCPEENPKRHQNYLTELTIFYILTDVALASLSALSPRLTWLLRKSSVCRPASIALPIFSAVQEKNNSRPSNNSLLSRGQTPSASNESLTVHFPRNQLTSMFIIPTFTPNLFKF